MITDPASLTVRVGCDLRYQFDQATPMVLLVRPENIGHCVTSERWQTDPTIAFHDYRDLYGNLCRRLTAVAGEFTLRYEANVVMSPYPAVTDWSAAQVPVDALPDDVLVYTLPSRYCLSDELADTAWDLFGRAAPGWSCVQTICDWVNANIRFSYGTSTPLTTAADVFRTRTGVCRDFAHLAITFCRALSIPARYAFGYLPDIGVPPPDAPMDFCAWFEAYLGGRWWTFDPRNNQRRIGAIGIGRGRDALDVAMVTTYGAAMLREMIVYADEIPS